MKVKSEEKSTHAPAPTLPPCGQPHRICAPIPPRGALRQTLGITTFTATVLKETMLSLEKKLFLLSSQLLNIPWYFKLPHNKEWTVARLWRPAPCHVAGPRASGLNPNLQLYLAQPFNKHPTCLAFCWQKLVQFCFSKLWESQSFYVKILSLKLSLDGGNIGYFNVSVTFIFFPAFSIEHILLFYNKEEDKN